MSGRTRRNSILPGLMEVDQPFRTNRGRSRITNRTESVSCLLCLESYNNKIKTSRGILGNIHVLRNKIFLGVLPLPVHNTKPNKFQSTTHPSPYFCVT